MTVPVSVSRLAITAALIAAFVCAPDKVMAQNVAPSSVPATPPEVPGERDDEVLPEPPPQEPAAQDTDALFRQVFGRDRPAVAAGDYAVVIDTVYVGDYRIDPQTNGGSISSDFVGQVLSPITIGETREKLRSMVDDPVVSFDQLRELGLSIEFDPAQLALRISIPPGQRTVRELLLRTAGRRGASKLVQPADFSALLSVRGGVDYIFDSNTLDTGLHGFGAVIDAAINIKGFALEGQFIYDETRNRAWSRRDIRLTYDWIDELIRFEAGDLSVGRRPLQDTPRMAGLAAYREFPINPYRQIRPVSERGFELSAPARVEILVNGVPSKTLALDPGRYNLRDFPLVPSAANELELRVRYIDGRVETLYFSAFTDIDLLEPGLSDFAINVGLPYRDNDGARVYDNGNYNVLGYYRRGITPTFTAGINWEGDRYFDTIGAEATWASPFGSFLLNVATNIREPGPHTGRASLQYSWRDVDPDRGRSIDAQVILTGEDYRTLNQLFGGSLVSFSAQARAGQAFGRSLRAQIFGGYESGEEIGSRTFAGASISRQFDFGNVGLSGEYLRSANDEDAVVVRLSLSVPIGRGAVTGNYSTRDNAARLDYTRLGAIGVGSLGYAAGIERRDDFNRQFARATYLGNRFEASVDASRGQGAGGRRDLRSSLSFGTALVMADGTFAIGRPVSNSFAIVGLNSEAGDYRLAVEPRVSFGGTEKSYNAYSGLLGPAVVPTLTPYFDRSIQVEAPGAPVGTSLGGTVFSVRPGYRTGHKLVVGSGANAAAVGSLQLPDGAPLAFASGTVRRADRASDEEFPPVFTNRTGRFFVEGLEAGETYLLVFTIEGEIFEAQIVLPEEAIGIVRFNELIALANADTMTGD